MAKHKLQEARQEQEKLLEDSGRVQQLATSGYPVTPLASIHAASKDIFLKGYVEHQAPFAAMNGKPATVADAPRLMKADVTEKGVVSGPGPRFSKVRQVAQFTELESAESQVSAVQIPPDPGLRVRQTEQESSELNLQIRRLNQQILKALGRRSATQSSWISLPNGRWTQARPRSPLPAHTREWFVSSSPGHFIWECPGPPCSQSPSPQERPLNGLGLTK